MHDTIPAPSDSRSDVYKVRESQLTGLLYRLDRVLQVISQYPGSLFYNYVGKDLDHGGAVIFVSQFQSIDIF